MTGSSSIRRRARQNGVGFLSVLVFIAITALAASTLVASHRAHAQRENEEELLFAGDQIRQAILSYYNTVPPGGPRSLPPTLQDLVNDHRFPIPRQHLRRIFVDPMTGKADWELVTRGAGIVGVHSRSAQKPLKKNGFPSHSVAFEDAESYRDWVFAIRLQSEMSGTGTR